MLACIISSFVDYHLGIAISAAIFFPFCFLIFLYKIDVFERERFKDIFVVFLMSLIISTLLGVLWVPVRDTLLGPMEEGFVVMFLGAGLPEEIIKIIPVLIVLKRTKFINEPIDYVIYASTAALGFAFFENISYIYNFKEAYPNIMAVRSLYPTLMHIATSSAIGLGFFFYHETKKFKYLIVFYFLASIAHAIYNVFPYTLIILIIFYARLIQSLINISPFYDEDNIKYLKSAAYFLGYILLAVLLLDFVFYRVYENIRHAEGVIPTEFPYKYIILLSAVVIYKIISRHLKVNQGEFKIFGKMKIKFFSEMQDKMMNNFYNKLDQESKDRIEYVNNTHKAQ